MSSKPVAKGAATAASSKHDSTRKPLKNVTEKAQATPETNSAKKRGFAANQVKTPKPKMERDSFTMPKDEYAQIALLKRRLEGLGRPVKKSELLRAGLKLLSAMDDVALTAALADIPAIKTGRPKK